MNTLRSRSFAAPAILAAALVAAATASVRAGGPLLVDQGRAVLWSGREITGGPLGSTTVSIGVTGKRTVHFHVDSGPLGPLTNAEAMAIVDRIFDGYSRIPTANIRFRNDGFLRDPDTGAVVDVDGENFGKFIEPTLQNPIIFDSDGGITGGGGVLGFFGLLAFDEGPPLALAEGIVVLNGSVLGAPFFLDPASFIGVFTHEFGHFVGPLDHAQINGALSVTPGLAGPPRPPGFTSSGQLWDVFAPHIETMFSFLLGQPASATLQLDSGFFIATMDQDTVNALSNLYPTREYRKTTGSIEGEVFFRSGAAKILVNGINVVVRRSSQGTYHPTPADVAYLTPPVFDEDGVPFPPDPRAATDPLVTVSSAVTGLDFGRGTYRVQGLTPDDYMVTLQAIVPPAVGGSSIGPLQFQLTLPVAEEFYNGSTTTSTPASFTPVPVRASKTVNGIDLEIIGLDTSRPRRINEDEPHNTIATALTVPSLPVMVKARSADDDPAEVFIQLSPTARLPIHDLYKFTLTGVTLVFISLEAEGAGAGDLDIWLFRAPTNPAVVPIAAIPRFSATEESHELIGARLGAGDWYIGVTAFSGKGRYKLRIVPQTF